MTTLLKKEHEGRSKPTTIRTFALIAIFWTAIILFLGLSANSLVKDNIFRLTLTQARSFFHMIVNMRYWNAFHGGLYAPLTQETQPNPFLDVPNRDITTQTGQELTLINPAYMTRQLSEIASKRDGDLFHITSQNPIRPANRPYPWEEKALQTFVKKNDEYYEWNLPETGKKEFRYMAPLWVEDACLQCHAKQGYKLGELRGGISVSLPADTLLSTRDSTLWKLDFGFLGIWLFGSLFIYIFYKKTVADLTEREIVIEKLLEALREIKTLKGIIPICSSCKKIRKDSGAWEQLENYISKHSDAQFSHGLCPDCLRQCYPEYKDIMHDD